MRECAELFNLDMDTTKPVMTPMSDSTDTQRHLEEDVTPRDAYEYRLFRAAVGKLQLISKVKPELKLATEVCSH